LNNVPVPLPFRFAAGAETNEVYVKNRLSGLACLVILCCVAPLAAQQPPQTQDAPPPTPPQSEAQPPDTQTPPQASPMDMPQPSEETPHLPSRLPLPPLPNIVDVRMPGERGVAIGLGGWSVISHVSILKGRAASTEYPGNLYLNSAQKYGEGMDVTVAAGLHNVLRFTGDVTRASGSTTAPSDLVLWNRQYYAGNYITTAYRVRHLKASFEYLSWPYPVKASRFRLRSIWALQYVDAQTTFNAPLNATTDANGNPIVDALGDLVKYDATATKWYVTPSVGLGVQEYFTPNISFEATATGFEIPHHTNIWDADAAVNVRVGHYEIRLGAKAFHFHTSPNVDFTNMGTLFGPFLVLRWHSDVGTK
jgi:hypothetical protein